MVSFSFSTEALHVSSIYLLPEHGGPWFSSLNSQPYCPLWPILVVISEIVRWQPSFDEGEKSHFQS